MGKTTLSSESNSQHNSAGNKRNQTKHQLTCSEKLHLKSLVKGNKHPSIMIVSYASCSTGSLIVTSSGTLHMAGRVTIETGYYSCNATNFLGSDSKSSFVFFYNDSQVNFTTLLSIIVQQHKYLDMFSSEFHLISTERT